MSIGQHSTPIALRGKRTISSSVHRLNQYVVSDEHIETLRALATPPQNDSDDVLQFVQRTHLGALGTVSDLKKVRRSRSKRDGYPATRFGRQLQLTAKLIRTGMRPRVYYTQQTGYDTHAGQLPEHGSLLRELSESLASFLGDMEEAGQADRVTVMAFSEFGRRVAENGAQGTDHGTSGPVFLAGGKVEGGVHGQTPSLTDLLDGDLKMSVDFRQVYASILNDWLGLPVPRALGKNYQGLPLIRA